MALIGAILVEIKIIEILMISIQAIVTRGRSSRALTRYGTHTLTFTALATLPKGGAATQNLRILIFTPKTIFFQLLRPNSAY